MGITGEKRIKAGREQVWDLLHDANVLGHCLPGCEGVERSGENAFDARLALKLGPIRARIVGCVTLEDRVFPEACTVVGRGEGGGAGFAEGRAAIRLGAESPECTVLSYDLQTRIGGRLGLFSTRLIDAGMHRLADRFFDRFALIAARKGGGR